MIQWSKTPPTEPGWYWFYSMDHTAPFVEAVEVLEMMEGGLAVRLSEYAKVLPLKYITNAYWLGPIDVPENPEE